VRGYRWNEHTARRRILALLLLASLLVLSFSSLTHASTPAIDKAKSQAQVLIDLIAQLDQELGAATEDYNYANQQLADTQAAAKKTAADLKKTEKDLVSAQDLLNRRVVNIYKAGNPSVLGVLLDADSFSDLISRLDELTRLGEQDADLVKQVQEYRVQVTERKATLETQLQEEKTYAAQTAAAKQKVLAQLDKQKEALKGKEVQIAQLKKEEAARQAKLAAEARAAKALAASRGGRVVKIAMQYLGVPYVWGGASPRGFDCSGLVLYSYAKVGVTLPHSSRMQIGSGKPVSRDQLKVGDLVFFYSPIQHVGIYIGNGRMINATGTQVQISDVWQNSYAGACRIP
jgi:cell wall-associated NlpC family hydrolase